MAQQEDDPEAKVETKPEPAVGRVKVKAPFIYDRRSAALPTAQENIEWDRSTSEPLPVPKPRIEDDDFGEPTPETFRLVERTSGNPYREPAFIEEDVDVVPITIGQKLRALFSRKKKA